MAVIVGMTTANSQQSVFVIQFVSDYREPASARSDNRSVSDVRSRFDLWIRRRKESTDSREPGAAPNGPPPL
jgi:hypothetical protein